MISRFACLAAECAVVFLLACGARPDSGASSSGTETPDASTPDVGPPPPPPMPPPTPPSFFSTPVRVSIGPVTPGEIYKFAVPPNALAFNVVVTGGAFSTDVGVRQLVSPTGNTVTGEHIPSGGNHAVTVGTNGTAAAECPQTDATGVIPIESGTWSAVFSGPENAKLVASVVIQVTDDGKFHGGLLDLHVYVPDNLEVKGTPINALQAPDNPDVEARMKAFFDRTALHAAVYRGKIAYHRTPAAYRTIDDPTELVNSFKQTLVVPDGTQALHVILAERIVYSLGKEAWGIASGIPGAATRSGTVASGVAIVFLGDTPEEDAAVLEHEAGHFFGLSHTTEFMDGLHDPLTDTPVCDDMGDPKSCPDNVDVMFPMLLQPPELTQFTLSQSTIFATNPAVRAYRDGKHGNSPKSSKVPVPHPPSERVRSFRCVSGIIGRL